MNIKRFPLAIVALIAIVAAASATVASGPAAAQGDPRVDAIVMFDSAPGPAAEAQVRAAGGVITQRYQVLPILAVSLPEGAIAGLSHQPNVVSVEKERDDLRFHDHGTAVVGQELQWGANRIDAEYAHNNGATGDGVIVAVLDTGIDRNHPDFEGRIDGRAQSFAGRNPTSNVTDKNGHGTHTSGIIGAGNNEFGVVGVAPDVTILPIQIAKGSRIKDSAILAAYDYLLRLTDPTDSLYIADQVPQVVNMSYGGSKSNAEELALNLLAPHMTLVASAGNSSGGAVGYPAALASVLAISSTTINDTLSSFSSVGPQVAYAAPGSSVYSTYKDGLYAHMSGTSMAAPHVAGVAALVAGGPTGSSLTAEFVGSDPNAWGAGLIDAASSVLVAGGDDLDLGNRAPSVDAGPDQTVAQYTDVIVTGTASDPDGDALTIDWTVVAEPVGSTLVPPTQESWTFNANLVGTYTLQFEATETESEGLSDVDTVTITVFDPTDTTQYGVATITAERKAKGRFPDVKFTVTVLEDDGTTPLEGAVGTADVYRKDRTFPGLQGTTNAQGEIVFTIKRAHEQEYSIDIVSMTHSNGSFSWDGVQAHATESVPYPAP